MQNRGSIIGGLILILVGALFLLLQAFPDLAAQFDPGMQWPLIFVAVGLLFMIGAVLGEASLAVPGAIIGGLGGLFYYQNLSGDLGQLGLCLGFDSRFRWLGSRHNGFVRQGETIVDSWRRLSHFSQPHSIRHIWRMVGRIYCLEPVLATSANSCWYLDAVAE